MTKLGDVLTISANKSTHISDKNWLLNLDMVQQQTGKILAYNYVTANELCGSIIGFDNNVVLYSKLRPNLNKVVLPDKYGFCTSELLPLLPDSKQLNREYLAWFLRSDSFVNWAATKTAGAKMPRLGTKELLSKEIPLPDLPTQQRIADTLDKVSEGIEVCRKMIGELEVMVQSRFNEVMDFAELSDETTVEKITERVKVGFVGTCEKYYTDETGIPMIRTGNITNHGIDMRNLKYVTSEFNKRNKKSQIHNGDLLIARHGSNGQANVYEGPEAQCLNAVVIVPNQTVAKSRFLAELINSPAIKEQINRTLVGSTQNVVNTKSIANLTIRIPSLKLQEEYESYVEKIDKTKLTIQKILDKMELEKLALMQEYFG